MNSIVKKRIYSFDLLRLLSILIVMSHHMMMDMYVLHPMHNLKFVETILVGGYTNIALMSTAMFMLVSGASLALKGREEKPLSFYKKRLIRLLIPFYFAYIICFVIRVINAGTFRIFGGIPKWRFVFTLMGVDEYLGANGVRTFTLGVGEWFLGAIILCCFVYPFLFKANKKYRWLTFVFMTVFNLFINFNYDLFHFVIPSHMNFFCQVYNFYLGMFFVDERCISKIDKKVLYITIPILVALFTINLPFLPNIKTTIAIAMVFLTFYAIDDFISSIKSLTTLLVQFSKISLEVFLVHHFVIYQVDYMLSYRQMGGLMTLIVICFDFVITVLLAIFVEFLTRKVTSFVYKTKKQRYAYTKQG